MQLGVAELMKAYKVPGLSVAVIDNFKIAWTKAYGVTEAGSANPVTVHTLFQAGSISKPVAATGALYLVEHGKLSLDENVNDKLKSWQVPDNEFTKDQKVTLRRLLSHSAGITVHGFPGYQAGTPIPTLVQIFDGEKPANTMPIRVDLVPGTQYRYSGGGVTIEQQLILDVTGRPFPQFMREIVFEKIGMLDSTYEQPLPPSRAAMAASGARGDGTATPGKWHIYPEMAAAGLWTTPGDLAKFGIETALSKHGKANHVLSQTMTRERLKPQIEQVGLGFFLGEGNNPEEFGHAGDDDGFEANLIMFADTGKGVAIMTNSNNGLAVSDFVLRSIAKEYGWNYAVQQQHWAGILWLVADTRGTAVAVRKYEELKKSSPTELNENDLLEVAYQLLSAGKTADAIQIFKLQVVEYPKYWNSYDSMGEAYMRVGEKDLAIANYEKSLELKPDNQNGIDMIKKLKEQ